MIHFTSQTVDSDLKFTEDLPKLGQTLLVWCTGCGKSHEWTVPGDDNLPPHYCSRRCRERNKARKKRGEYLTCPRPDKNRYRTAQAAEQAFRDVTKNYGLGATVYLCRCGVYHLGNAVWVVLDD